MVDAATSYEVLILIMALIEQVELFSSITCMLRDVEHQPYISIHVYTSSFILHRFLLTSIEIQKL